jgi:hypothetical protein
MAVAAADNSLVALLLSPKIVTRSKKIKNKNSMS